MLLFLIIATALGFVVLTAVTVVGVLKHLYGDTTIWLCQRFSGLVFTTTAAPLKLQLYEQPVTFWPVSLEWVVLVFAAYAWGWFVYFLSSYIQERIQGRKVLLVPQERK